MREDSARQIEGSTGQQSEGERLHSLFRLHWTYNLDEYPELATYTGDPGRNHRWTDHSLEAYDRRNREMEIPARVLATIDRAALSASDQVHYDLFRRNAIESLEGRRFKGEYMPVTQMGGVQQNVAQYLMLMPYFQRTDVENAVARMEAVPQLVDQTIALLEKGVETGITPPRVTLRDVPEQVRNQITDDPAASPMLRPFQSLPPTIEPPVAETLRAAAARAYTAAVAPAYRRLLEYLETRYLPRTRETIAARDLPDGEAWYAFSIRQMTTTRLSAQEIHDIGLAEVKRIRAEMDAVMAGSGFDGTFQQFVGFLRTGRSVLLSIGRRTSSSPIATSASAWTPSCQGSCDSPAAALRRRAPPVPSYAEKSQTTAYYEAGLALRRPARAPSSRKPT